MALNVWTKPSGYNFGTEPGTNVTVNSGSFIPGYQYVITFVGTTDFTKIGADYNVVGTIFKATAIGSLAGPTELITVYPDPHDPSKRYQTTKTFPGNGTASRISFSERVPLNITLPTQHDAGVTYSVISGQLPPGSRLEGKKIIGSPYEVARITDFTFCIRASKNGEIADRTFTISIEGPDAPEFITPAGELVVGDHKELYVMDSTYVDYQIEAVDFDTGAGQHLSFFIADGDGTLPPGLVLTDTGRLVGFIQPILSIKPADGAGLYDDSFYDVVGYDFAFKPTNGYDSYLFDSVFFDFSLSTGKPKKLNRTYQFTITLSDGDTFIKRTFRLFVVGDDYFRADNTTWLDGNPLFTADVTYMRPPVWVTTSYLGIHRANNYITLLLETYDKENIIYSLEQINANTRATTLQKLLTDNISGGYTLTTTLTSNVPSIGHFLTFSGLVQQASVVNRIDNVQDLGNNEYRLTLHYPLEVNVPNDVEFLIGTHSQLPPGMKFDENNSSVFGNVPYQPAITKTYTFTVTATRISGKLNTSDYVFIPSNKGIKISEIHADKAQYPGVSAALNNVTSLVINNITYDSSYITSINYDNPTEVIIYLSTNIIINDSTKVNILYTSLAGERSSTPKIFTVDILGEVDSVMSWVTPSNLSSVNANFISTLSVKANSTIPNATVLYTLTSGSLPPGLTLDLDGEIVGKVNQYATGSSLGLTSFDLETAVTTFDGNTTSVDRDYSFTVKAQDQYGYSAISRTFTIKIDTPNQLVYSNIKVKPFLNLNQRALWKSFIDNTDVFTPESIYRPNDTNFGIQTELSMLVYAGIETRDAGSYISAMGLNHKRKRFQFGNLTKAVAVEPGTTNQIYEVVYLEMIDPLEPNGKRLPTKIQHLSADPNTITVDKSNIFWSRSINDLSINAPTSERPDARITVDSKGYEVSDPNATTYFPSSISNWRERLKKWSDGSNSFSTERNYLPLWMRSIQPGSKKEIDFKLAVPICYCKVGYGDATLLRIKNYLKTTGFSFNQLDYTADRYIIDSVQGLTADKYLVFRNDRITI